MLFARLWIKLFATLLFEVTLCRVARLTYISAHRVAVKKRQLKDRARKRQSKRRERVHRQRALRSTMTIFRHSGSRHAGRNQSKEVTKHRGSEVNSRGNNILSLVILLHIVAITTWASPFDLPLCRDIKELATPYLVWSGLFQSWDTFAPNPKADNSHIKALVIADSHPPQVWPFPRMQGLGFWDRYQKERYRKFEEVIVQPQFAIAWPDVARHLAMSLEKGSQSEEKVVLLNYSTAIVPWHDPSSDGDTHTNIFFDDYVEVEATR